MYLAKRCAVIILLVLTRVAQGEMHSEYFAEIKVRVLAEIRGNELPVLIDSLYHLSPDGTRRATDTLQVSCPSAGMTGWRTFLHRGDTLTLEWRVERAPNWGWLFFGGRGGTAAVTIPSSGIGITCSCRGKSDSLSAYLSGLFLTNGGAVSKIQCRGRSESLIKRLLPFWRGRVASPPRDLGLLLGWIKTPENTQSADIRRP